MIILVFALAPSQSKQVTGFSELMNALKGGAEARVVIDYARCRLVMDSAEVKAPEAIGGMSLSTYEYFAPMVVRNPKAYVTSSQTVLISHPRYGYVLNYVKIKIVENDSVEVTARYLNPGTYQIVMDETFYGSISKGDDGRGVRLYVR
jgi:hypothetical protein